MQSPLRSSPLDVGSKMPFGRVFVEALCLDVWAVGGTSSLGRRYDKEIRWRFLTSAPLRHMLFYPVECVAICKMPPCLLNHDILGWTEWAYHTAFWSWKTCRHSMSVHTVLVAIDVPCVRPQMECDGCPIPLRLLQCAFDLARSRVRTQRRKDAAQKWPDRD